jgi:hypothetical protein
MPLDNMGDMMQRPLTFLDRFMEAVKEPFKAPVTWGRLSLIVGFIIVVALMWRQVINMIVED